MNTVVNTSGISLDTILKSKEIYKNSLSLSPDWNLEKEYYRYVPGYKILRESLLNQIHHCEIRTNETFFDKFIQSNPDYFQVYSLIGEYYFVRKGGLAAVFARIR